MALVKSEETGRFVKTHSMSRTSEYAIWGNMLYRCNTDTCPLYKNYGGRGIKVCDEWHDFENFFLDMGPKPSDGHSIDRIDVNKGYYPENCRWLDKKGQANNRRNSFLINGMTVPEVSDLIGVSEATIRSRYHRGWTEEKILSKRNARKGRNASN